MPAKPPALERDKSPIDQAWIKEYLTQLESIMKSLDRGNLMIPRIVARHEHVCDLVEAWQKRSWPIDQR